MLLFTLFIIQPVTQVSQKFILRVKTSKKNCLKNTLICLVIRTFDTNIGKFKIFNNLGITSI